jgi:hypothetical protein
MTMRVKQLDGQVVVVSGASSASVLAIALGVADRIAGAMVDRRPRDPPPRGPIDAPHRPGDASARDWRAWASAEDPPRACRAPDAPSGPAPVTPAAPSAGQSPAASISPRR